MDETFTKDLAGDFEKLYESKERYDTIITVGKEPNVEPIYAHSVILCTRSPYFRRALSDEWAEKKDGYFILSKPNISALIFNIILNQKVEIILELLVAADELLIQKLIDFIQEFLIKNIGKFLQKDIIKTVHFVAHNNQFNELKEAYLKIICDDPYFIFSTEEFFQLEEEALKLILKCDNLNMKEIEIWIALVEWGINQQKKLKSDMMCEDTNSEDINPLGETLGELIKFIRFHQMDREEFMPEVWKYKHLLSEQLIEDILSCLLDSDFKPLYNTFLIRWGNFQIDSVLINKEIALLLMKWIDRKTIDDNTSKGFHYSFNLLFRSSLDGLSSKTFHRKCDNKGATIVVAKDLNSNYLVGGYNPIRWNCKKAWKQTTDSFLFALDQTDFKNAKVSRIKHLDCSIVCSEGFGPLFGEGDLYVTNNDNTWQLKPKCYPSLLS
ncbi:3440_t:CDS:2, partial [Dentiscutata heterogama]